MPVNQVGVFIGRRRVRVFHAMDAVRTAERDDLARAMAWPFKAPPAVRETEIEDLAAASPARSPPRMIRLKAHSAPRLHHPFPRSSPIPCLSASHVSRLHEHWHLRLSQIALSPSPRAALTWPRSPHRTVSPLPIKFPTARIANLAKRVVRSCCLAPVRKEVTCGRAGR